MQQGCLRNCQAVQAKTRSKSAASIPRLSSIAFDMAAANSLHQKKKICETVEERESGSFIGLNGVQIWCRLEIQISNMVRVVL